MNREIKERVILVLRESGFKGSMSHFRGKTEERIVPLNF